MRPCRGHGGVGLSAIGAAASLCGRQAGRARECGERPWYTGVARLGPAAQGARHILAAGWAIGWACECAHAAGGGRGANRRRGAASGARPCGAARHTPGDRTGGLPSGGVSGADPRHIYKMAAPSGTSTRYEQVRDWRDVRSGSHEFRLGPSQRQASIFAMCGGRPRQRGRCACLSMTRRRPPAHVRRRRALWRRLGVFLGGQRMSHCVCGVRPSLSTTLL